MSTYLNIHRFEIFKEFIDFCITFYKKNKEKFNDKSISERRSNLSMFIEKFHIESGTLNSEIKEKIEVLRRGKPIILMTAHQPNLLPYSGVLRKATLNYVIGKELEKRLGVKVVNFYGIADQDFTDDRWVKSSLLPAINRKEGILNININLPSNIVLKNVPRPSIDIINKWKVEIETWLYNATDSINNFCKENDIMNWNSKKLQLCRNFEIFWKIVEEAYTQATTYSDLNAFIISKIINEVWGYDTLFSRFSDCQRIFSHEFNYLLSNYDNYKSFLKEAINLLPKNVRMRGVSENETIFLPFWYHCDCGSKVRLSIRNQDESIIGHGLCINCKKEYNINMGKKYNIDVSEIASNISARAIPMILIFSKGLGLSCYVGGIGGKEYLKEASFVAKKMDISFPPTLVWRPHDKYLSISKLKSLLEYKRITGHYNISKWEKEVARIESKINEIYKEINILEEKKKILINKLKKGEIDNLMFKNNLKNIINKIDLIKNRSKMSIMNRDLKIIKNISIILTLIPSIIDYAINIGLAETSEQWINFLVTNGSFSSDVYLTSLLDDITDLTFLNQ